MGDQKRAHLHSHAPPPHSPPFKKIDPNSDTVVIARQATGFLELAPFFSHMIQISYVL